MLSATRSASPQSDKLVSQPGDMFYCVFNFPSCFSEPVLNKPHLVKRKERKHDFLILYHPGPNRNSP